MTLDILTDAGTIENAHPHAENAKPLCVNEPMNAVDWNDLQYFLAVARSSRLTAAARRLGVNHSTVDRRIRALEASLGTRLFDRLPSGFQLTQRGEDLLPYAEQMETHWLAAASEIAGGDVQISGNVRIGAPDGLGTYFLARRLAHFSTELPALDVELVAMPRVLNPSKREVDITIGFSRPDHGRLVSRKLTDYTLHLYASKDYLDAHGTPRDIEDLTTRPLIGYIEELIFVPELDYLWEISEKLHARLTSTNIVAQLMMAREGRGICVLPYFMARQHPELVMVLPERVITRSYFIMYAESLSHIARIRRTLESIIEWTRVSRSELIREAEGPRRKRPAAPSRQSSRQSS